MILLHTVLTYPPFTRLFLMLVPFSSPLAIPPLFSGPLQKVAPTFRSTPTPPKYYVSANILCLVCGLAKFLLIIKNNVLKMIMVKFCFNVLQYPFDTDNDFQNLLSFQPNVSF